MLGSNLLIGRYATAEQSERLVLPLMGLLGGGLLLFALHPGLIIAAVLASCSTSGLGYEIGLQRRFLHAMPESARGQAFGLLSTGLMTGQALATMTVGAATMILGPSMAIAAFGLLIIVSGLALMPHLRPKVGRPIPADVRVVKTGADYSRRGTIENG